MKKVHKRYKIIDFLTLVVLLNDEIGYTSILFVMPKNPLVETEFWSNFNTPNWTHFQGGNGWISLYKKGIE